MIDYSSKIFEVIDSVHHIVAKEMSIPIFMDSHQGNHSILIQPISDNLLEVLSKGQTRTYTILISYELNTGGNYTENIFKQVANVAEHIKRLFAPDNNARDGDDYFGGQVESVEYEKDEEEAKMRAILTLTVKTFEAQ